MFKFEDTKCYLMPAHFGGSDYGGPDAALYYRDTVSMLFSYRTDGDRLANYLPEDFELIRPELNIGYQQCRQVDWMAGGAYNLIAVSVPSRFNGKRDRVDGLFALVIWENRTAPILGGREQNGMPKIYADIEDLHIIQQSCFTNASYEGNTFLRVEMAGAQSVEGPELTNLKALGANGVDFGWCYIPKVNGPGAELSQPILYPRSAEISAAWKGSGIVQWTELTWQQNPGQCHIIKALAELPMIEMAPVVMTKGVSVLKPMQGRVLE